MIKRVSDLIPKLLADELLRLARLDRDWVQWIDLGNGRYEARCRQSTWVRRIPGTSGADLFGMWATSLWIVDGPKVFRPSPEQCAALEQVEVRLALSDYRQAYPCLLVDLPTGYEPFTSVLCHRTTHLLSCVLNGPDHQHDITTTIATDGRPMEESIRRYDADCAEDAIAAGRALRVAINANLVLANYGATADAMFPADAASDERLAKEGTERGERARQRLSVAPQLVKLAQDIVLHRTEVNRRGTAEPTPTGANMPAHWRRGHWHTVLHGKGKQQRRVVLYPPVFVRADRFLGDLVDTSTTYK